jgi:hypothetical protein
MQTRTLTILLGLLAARAAAQNVLFDFENAQAGSSLPLDLTVGGITAQFSATGLGGYFIQQPQSTIGYSPAGFSGNCLVPSSVYAADLHVGFSQTLTDFSILYAPQELACDSSATVRVTAYLNGVFVGTSTTNANPPGTWPSATLAFSSGHGFNSVVVHYDAPPPTGGDYGVIFVADNMTVTPAPPPIFLSQAARLASGAFQFAFTNTPGATFTALAATNLALPLTNWTALGGVTETSPGQFLFTDLQATNSAQRFYRIRSP